MVQINGHAFPEEHFLNNEGIYKKVPLNTTGVNVITLKFENNGDIVDMMIAAEFIRDELGNNTDIILEMPYIPYSAMDREINDQIFTLKIFGNMISSMGFKKVKVLDPHNKNVAEQYIKNIAYIDINYYTGKAMDDFQPDVIFFPDKGAMSKYPAILDTRGLLIIHGKKERDLANRGRIAKFDIVTNGINIEGKRVLIIDDICRKGGTFTLAASELKKLNVGDIALYVSHCEACIFDGNILNEDSPITKVYTNDSEPGFINRMKEDKKKGDKIVIIKN